MCEIIHRECIQKLRIFCKYFEFVFVLSSHRRSMCCRRVYISHFFDHLILYCSIILAHIVYIYRLLSPHFKKNTPIMRIVCFRFDFIFCSVSLSVGSFFSSCFSLFLSFLSSKLTRLYTVCVYLLSE